MFIENGAQGGIYKENKIGPQIELWGSPPVIAAEEEEIFPVLTEQVLSFK